jgi:hypothetical protein
MMGRFEAEELTEIEAYDCAQIEKKSDRLYVYGHGDETRIVPEG